MALFAAMAAVSMAVFFLPAVWALALIAGLAPFCIIGVHDLYQPAHSVRRNYPIIGRLRWCFERIRPEIRQYLIEGDNEKSPFSRSQRSLVYARAKNEASDRAFGTLANVYENGYEFIGHSMSPAEPADPATFKVTIGGSDGVGAYDASIFNISAMSFGALSANAISALNKGALKGGFAQDTGEGGISTYHRKHGGDLIWEIGSGYFGCRTSNGSFDPARFAEQAADDQIKMIELKLSQGAKPGRGGILPGQKVTAEIAAARGVMVGVDCISPARHTAFSTPIEIMEFVEKLRNLARGKPVGLKLCVGQPWEFMGLVKAMRETRVNPDFIVVDGAEGGTGAAPVEFADNLGMPMRESLLFTHNTLVGAGLRDRIKIGVAGKITSAFDLAAAMALGADWTNAGRAFMFALGCIQSLSCHNNRCPAGVATQDPLLQRGLVVTDKAERVYQYHRNTMVALADMIAAAGLTHPNQLGPQHLVRRVSPTEIRLFSQLHMFLESGELLTNSHDRDFYSSAWRIARADTFGECDR